MIGDPVVSALTAWSTPMAVLVFVPSNSHFSRGPIERPGGRYTGRAWQSVRVMLWLWSAPKIEEFLTLRQARDCSKAVGALLRYVNMSDGEGVSDISGDVAAVPN